MVPALPATATRYPLPLPLPGYRYRPSAALPLPLTAPLPLLARRWWLVGRRGVVVSVDALRYLLVLIDRRPRFPVPDRGRAQTHAQVVRSAAPTLLRPVAWQRNHPGRAGFR